MLTVVRINLLYSVTIYCAINYSWQICILPMILMWNYLSLYIVAALPQPVPEDYPRLPANLYTNKGTYM